MDVLVQNISQADAIFFEEFAKRMGWIYKTTAEENKEKLLKQFLDFASDNYLTDTSFKFNREELYHRENIR